MTYCDKAGMIARFGEVELIRLTDPDDSLSEDSQIDDDAINAALSDATDEIDSYLAVRHSLPLSTTPKLLVRLCADIARYRLYDDRMIEEVEKRYNASIRMLKDIAKGTASLPIEQRQAEAGCVSAQKNREDRVFTGSTLEDF